MNIFAANIRRLCTRVVLQMAESTPRPCVFCGPSGSGKSTLIKKLMNEYKDCFGFSVSHTTRKPRVGEKEGVDYHYTTRKAMEEAIKNGDFIETAEFSGNLYGTSKKAVDDVLKQNRICILDIEMQGVLSIRQTNLKPMYIFIKPPSMTVLEERLRGRKSDTEEAIQKRLETARREMKFMNDQDDKDSSHVIINDDLSVAYEKLCSVFSSMIARLRAIKYNGNSHNDIT